MPRQTKAIVISAMLSTSAMAWHAPSTNTTSMRVSLTIVESCLVRQGDATTQEAAKRPGVACLHDAPYRTALLTGPAPDQPFGLAKTHSSHAMPLTTWQVTF
jgi:hypothetical protein